MILRYFTAGLSCGRLCYLLSHPHLLLCLFLHAAAHSNEYVTEDKHIPDLNIRLDRDSELSCHHFPEIEESSSTFGHLGLPPQLDYYAYSFVSIDATEKVTILVMYLKSQSPQIQIFRLEKWIVIDFGIDYSFRLTSFTYFSMREF